MLANDNIASVTLLDSKHHSISCQLVLGEYPKSTNATLYSLNFGS